MYQLSSKSLFFFTSRIFLIEDCCGDRDVQVHKSVMSTYDGYNCVVIKSQQIINNFKSNEK